MPRPPFSANGVSYCPLLVLPVVAWRLFSIIGVQCRYRSQEGSEYASKNLKEAHHGKSEEASKKGTASSEACHAPGGPSIPADWA